MDKMTEWKAEFEELKERLNNEIAAVRLYRGIVKDDESKLKMHKRQLHRYIVCRDKLRKEKERFWSRRKAKMAYRRKWATDHIGETVVFKEAEQ